MIIEAVFMFAAMSALFEFIVVMKLSPRTRCRVLGSPFKIGLIHLFTIGFNLFVHWGTLIGTSSAIAAGLASFVTIPIAAYVSGVIINGIYYPGLLKYKLEVLI